MRSTWFIHFIGKNKEKKVDPYELVTWPVEGLANCLIVVERLRESLQVCDKFNYFSKMFILNIYISIHFL